MSSLFPLSPFLIIPLQIYYLHPNGPIIMYRKRRKTTKRAKTCLILRLAANHEVHGSEEVLLRAGNEAVGALGEGIAGLLSSWWCEANLLEQSGEAVHQGAGGVCHAEDSEEVEIRLHVLHLSGNRPVPWERVSTVGEILVVEKIETGGLDGRYTLGNGNHEGTDVRLRALYSSAKF